MRFSPAVLIGVLPKLGELIGDAMEQYGVLRAMGAEVNADLLGAFVLTKMDGWSPQVLGRMPLHDEGTRQACARFLSGVAFNLVRGS